MFADLPVEDGEAGGTVVEEGGDGWVVGDTQVVQH